MRVREGPGLGFQLQSLTKPQLGFHVFEKGKINLPSELKGGKTRKRFIFIYLKFLFFRPLIVNVRRVIALEESSGETSDSQKRVFVVVGFFVRRWLPDFESLSRCGPERRVAVILVVTPKEATNR